MAVDKNNTINNYDKNYSKIMAMANSGMTNDQIAQALNLPVWKVVETRQIAYGRELKYYKGGKRES